MLYLVLLAMYIFPFAPPPPIIASRYINYVYSVNKTTVTYSSPYSLAMDIYQPNGDTSARRPLMILAHAGSFVGGTRISDAAVDSLCVRFARRGYVTASIDYRLGTMATMISDSAYAMAVMVKAMSDGKAAIRYFVKDAATSNTYRIDTNNIVVGGNSAGAILYMHVAYLNNLAECPAYMQTAMAANGGFDGNSGNAGYSSKVSAVINLAGALNKNTFIQTTDKPCISAQGTADVTVPFNTGYFLNNTVQLRLYGIGKLDTAFNTANIPHLNKIFSGSAHVPWTGNPAAFNSVDSLAAKFLHTVYREPGVW